MGEWSYIACLRPEYTALSGRSPSLENGQRVDVSAVVELAKKVESEVAAGAGNGTACRSSAERPE